MTRTDEATSSPASRRRWYLAILAFFLALLSLGAFLGWRRLANRLSTPQHFEAHICNDHSPYNSECIQRNAEKTQNS